MRDQGFKPLIVGLVSIVLVAGSYFFGYSVGHGNLKFEAGYRPVIANKELGKPKDVDFNLFWEVWEKVNEKYVGKVDDKKMVYDAINGALRSLDDPYTLFLPPDEAKRFNEDLRGNFEGIGAEIERRDDLVRVVIPLPDSPAEKAGVKAKDIILTIDGADTKDMSLEDAVGKIRGKKDTIVTLSVAREGATGPVEIKITRGTIVVKSVKSEIKEGNIGYIKMSQFGDDTKDLFSKAVDEMVAKNPKGLIIDLRNNPGGYLETAVDTASLFLKERGAIVKEKDKHGAVVTKNATLNAKLTETPIIILVNGGSASASEIFAGALQDYGRAKLLGEKTFGKGSVQILEDVAGGGSVRITIEEWITPKDRAINKVGITPDIEVKLTEDDVKNSRDPQLDKALEELKK